jgi:cellobiose-specific phosphotransferase system component IIA
MYVLFNKLKNVKGALKEFNLKYFGKISERMLEAKRKMEEAHVDCKQILQT